MKYHTLFPRLLDALVLLGVLTFSVAEENLTSLLIALPLVFAAAVLTRGPAAAHPPRWIINLALLTGTAVMSLSWLNDPGDTVSVLSRYVIWLQLTKVFELRTPRDYAQVITLSVMLVLGAALTSLRPDLALPLILYTPALLATLMLFQIVACLSLAPTAPALASGADSSSSHPAAATPPLFHLPDSLAGAAEVHEGRDFRRHFLFAGALILIFALPIYTLTPRGLGEALVGALHPPQTSSSTVGFRDHVQLGAQGLLSESRTVVMEMRVESSNEPGLYSRPLLLRGAVLDEYDPHKGLWRQSPGLWSSTRNRRWRINPTNPPSPPDADSTPLLTQRLTIFEHSRELFSVWRPLSFTPDPDTPGKFIDMRWNTTSGVVILTDSGSEALRQYTILSSPSSLVPSRPLPSLIQPTGRRLFRGLPRIGPRVCVKPTADAAPANPFAHGPIHDLALSILAQHSIDPSPVAPDQREWAAAAFRSFLQKNYTYTLEMEAPTPGRDPIESFLFDSNPEGAPGGGRGHCEYFASALAALCQSVGVPARVVTGYAATEVDPVTGLYTIRQNHAHAWTDIELEPGRWREFDPSPTAVIARLHKPPPGIVALFQRSLGFFQNAWVRSIVTYDRSSQTVAIRSARDSPLAALGLLNRWLSHRLARNSSESGDGENPALSLARVFAGVLVVSTFLALFFFALVTRGGSLLRWFFRLLHAPLPSAIERRLQSPGQLELARLRRRLERHFARAGLPRPRHTPPAEHAQSLSLRDPDLARDAARFIHLYYASHFGGLPPDRPSLLEARALAHSLRRRLASRPEPR